MWPTPGNDKCAPPTRWPSCSSFERMAPRCDCLFGINIVLDRNGRIRELHFGGMHSVAPEQKALTTTRQQIRRMPRRMSVFGNALNAGKQFARAIEGAQLSRLHIRADCLK